MLLKNVSVGCDDTHDVVAGSLSMGPRGENSPLPDAKSTFGSEHEESTRVPRTASRAGIVQLAMGDGITQFSF
jgi:hypothetical protein